MPRCTPACMSTCMPTCISVHSHLALASNAEHCFRDLDDARRGALCARGARYGRTLRELDERARSAEALSPRQPVHRERRERTGAAEAARPERYVHCSAGWSRRVLLHLHVPLYLHLHLVRPLVRLPICLPIRLLVRLLVRLLFRLLRRP